MARKAAEFVERLRQGRDFMGGLARKHELASRRYVDPTGETNLDITGGPVDLPQEVNTMAINVRQKIASVSIQAPDFVVNASDTDNALIVRELLRHDWAKGEWNRVLAKATLDRFLCGHGFVTYLYDPVEQFVLEHIDVRDVICDPNTIDATWNRMVWGGRTIHMPMSDAVARYGSMAEASAQSADVSAVRDQYGRGRVTLRPDIVDVHVLWDDEEEVEIIGERIVRRSPNYYGRVPIIVTRGNPHPVGPFSTGDYDEAFGTAETLRGLTNVLQEHARHKGGYAWVRPDLVGEDVRDAVLDNSHVGVVPISGAGGDEVFGYTRVAEISPALLEGIRLVSAGLDADQAVSQFSRGAVSRPSGLATEAALEVSAGGARAALARAEYEHVANMVAGAWLNVRRAFALDPRGGSPEEHDIEIFEAMLDTDEIRIIEESSAWRDPSQDQASAIALFDAVLRAIPVLGNLTAMGYQAPMPDLQMYLNDLLRAFRRKDVDKYWMPLPSVQGMPGDAGGGPLPAPPAQTPTPPGQEPLPPGNLGGLVPKAALNGALQEQPNG